MTMKHNCEGCLKGGRAVCELDLIRGRDRDAEEVAAHTGAPQRSPHSHRLVPARSW